MHSSSTRLRAWARSQGAEEPWRALSRRGKDQV